MGTGNELWLDYGIIKRRLLKSYSMTSPTAEVIQYTDISLQLVLATPIEHSPSWKGKEKNEHPTSPADDDTLLMKGLRDSVLTDYLEWYDGEDWK